MGRSSLYKSVQELEFLGSEELPEDYIYQDGEFSAVLPSQQIPLIDISLLLSPSSQQQRQELDNLRSALTSWGCFKAINHGMTTGFLGKVREVSKKFFDLPKEEKHKYEREGYDQEGYGSGIFFTQKERIDWNDHVCTSNCILKAKENFKDVLIEYKKKVKQLNEAIMKAVTKSLNLQEDSFLKQFGATNMIARFNYYPPCTRPELVMGLEPHVDGSAITFLLKDENVQGLQILKDNNWFNVPIIPETLVVNTGNHCL